MNINEPHIAVIQSRVDNHDDSLKNLWVTVEKIRDTLNDIRVQVAMICGGFGLLQTIVTGVIVHYISRS